MVARARARAAAATRQRAQHRLGRLRIRRGRHPCQIRCFRSRPCGAQWRVLCRRVRPPCGRLGHGCACLRARRMAVAQRVPAPLPPLPPLSPLPTPANPCHPYHPLPTPVTPANPCHPCQPLPTPVTLATPCSVHTHLGLDCDLTGWHALLAVQSERARLRLEYLEPQLLGEARVLSRPRATGHVSPHAHRHGWGARMGHAQHGARALLRMLGAPG